MVGRPPSRWLLVLLGLGLYLTIRGYESLDGDQAYRLPLLLHRQDPSLYANDPFVRAFDAFNPHSGYLALLDVASRALGLSKALFVLFSATFSLTAIGIDRLARSAWPGSGGRAGALAVVLVMATRAGNIGTNHLFEPVLLDRLIALALGWNALASVLERPKRGVWEAPALLLAASWVHPSMGLQLEMLLGAYWLLVLLLAIPGRHSWRGRSAMADPTSWKPGVALAGLIVLGVSMLPQLLRIPGQSEALLRGMTPDAFLLWTARVQSPQHMLPHLWRGTQWAAWSGFLALAGLSVLEKEKSKQSSFLRLWLFLGTILFGLLAGWVAVEGLHLWKVTVFQPFRMATVARGLALVLVSGRVERLWASRTWLGGVRVALLVAGLTSDLAFVAVVLAELAFALGEWSFGLRDQALEWSKNAFPAGFLGLGVLGLGLVYLHRSDPHWGVARIAVGLAFGLGLGVLRRLPLAWTTGRKVRLTAFAWAVPVFSALASWVWSGQPPSWVVPVVKHCRLVEVPTDPAEKLALWAREEVPASARLVVPPGDKTFRLWSRHSVSFNRAASPYHAEGLLDWSRRYRDHVGFEGPAESFARQYLADHLALEGRYDRFSSEDLADLARRQRASYVVAPALLDSADGPLRKLHAEGNYALYRVEERREVASRAGTGAAR